ncbi:hypothetical protein [Persicobacter sp. CCB-QB2]|uniref:type IX secretion system periplasmic lipoprotein PorW/SprE n=1 Tax=Persicobacter sp. CCB-QB2 TaxID=1561025 RepID=UPI0006A96166|nr:hypothetical protein [Persicobacter sp. CCB-QB2]
MPNSKIIYFFFVLTLLSCSAEKSKKGSTPYHNTAARFNGYFYAKEEIKEIEKNILDSNPDNFNDFLYVFPTVDSTIANANQEQLDEVIKMASLAIQRHPGSSWEDDSYYLVGKARAYAEDYPNAFDTFKFVNTRSKNDEVRHKALIALMRAYTDHQEFNNAVAVNDFLGKEALSKNNQKAWFLTQAHLYQKMQDKDKVIKNLELAIPLMKRKEGKARMFFLLGQIYQDLEFDALAYQNYRNVLSTNPSYELSFYAKLNLAQVTELNKANDIKRVRKYFKKLLKDQKNVDFKDKIYYELGAFEEKQENLDAAITAYKTSVQQKSTDPRQKGYTYWALGKVYYDKIKDYHLAKAYYDSTLTAMPQTDPNYELIANRQEILGRFVRFHDMVHVSDSLISLSEKDTLGIAMVLNGILDKEDSIAAAQAKLEKKQQRKEAAQAGGGGFFGGAGDPFGDAGFGPPSLEGGKWYFYDQSQMSRGKSVFLSNWGQRPLVDNWRLASKMQKAAAPQDGEEEDEEELDEDAPLTLGEATGEGNAPSGKGGGAEAAEENMESRESRYAALWGQIPFAQSDKDLLLEQVDEGLFGLGNIYHFELFEEDNAITSFEDEIDRFKSSEYRPEALYTLYLIYQKLGDPRMQVMADDLTTNFPKTLYAKLILNPNYREESNLATEQLKMVYHEAYNWYLQDSLKQVHILVDPAIRKHPDLPFTDYLRLLRVLVDGKEYGAEKYEVELQKFIDNYPNSELNGHAVNLLEAARNFQSKEEKKKAVSFVPYFEEEHLFVLLYPNEKEFIDELPARLKTFIDEEFRYNNLNTGNLEFNKEFAMVIVSKFDNKEDALQFYTTFNGEKSPLKEVAGAKIYNFVITNDNFQIFYKNKALELYESFFIENYQ